MDINHSDHPAPFPANSRDKHRSKPWVLFVIVSLVAIGLALEIPRNRRGSESGAPLDGTQTTHARVGSSRVSPASTTGSYTREITPRGPLDDDELSTIELFEKCSASVVHITTTVRNLNFNATEVPQGTGSGFIWDKQGNIVTNFHVIAGASEARVALSDQTEWRTDVWKVAPDKDLAVLKIKAPADQLVPLPIGTSADLQVGQTVYAIGNPFGLDQTLTTGVISGLGREIKSKTRRTIQDVIQTDAAINPGNSGGPLLDSGGRLMGVNTAIFSPSGAYAGIGFAIPVDTVNRTISQLLEFGRAIQPIFGILMLSRNGNQRIRELSGIEGVLVVNVAPNSTADDAGIRPSIGRYHCPSG